MPTATNAEKTEARQKQSDASKASTLDLLKSKSRARDTFTIYIDSDGTKQEVELTFQAIGATEYDKLVSKHPPKAEQRVDGASFDIDSFGPDLIHKVSLEPDISLKDAQEIWNSPDWSRGDVMVLFRKAVELNNRGVDIPFNGNG